MAAFNRLTGRESRFWTVNDVVANEYNGGRREGLSYDAAGHVISDDAAAYIFDAAGRAVTITGETSNSVVTFDGDGRSTKNVNVRTATPPGSSQTRTVYYLRSTVLSGLTVADLNASGQKVRGYVYAGERKVALTGAGAVSWEHREPLTGSLGMSYSNEIGMCTEFGPLTAAHNPATTVHRSLLERLNKASHRHDK